MQLTKRDYQVLADRVSEGDQEAGVMLKRHLEPKMVYFVWHELRFGKGKTVIGQQIRVEARRVALTCFRPERDSADRFVSQVAEGVCDWILEALATPAAQGLLNTAFCRTSRHELLDTVVA